MPVIPSGEPGDPLRGRRREDELRSMDPPTVHVQTRSAHGTVGWLDSLHAELDRREATQAVLAQALRDADQRFEAERDRRYSEAATLRDQALRERFAADDRALILAREIQAYRDEQANDLRHQIESERGLYLTRTEYDDKHATLVTELDTVKSSIAQLRTDVAVGPPGLPGLRSSFDAVRGEQQGASSQQERTYRLVMAVLGLMTVIVSVAIASHGF